MKRFYYLDLIRAIAAICVLLVHARYMCFAQFVDLNPVYQTPFVHALYPITNLGLHGVMCFFIMSGMLVGGRTIEKIKKDQISLHGFIANRISRLYPPLISVILLIIGVNYFLNEPNNILSLIGQLFGLQGVFVPDEGGVFWTLAYEVWFYVFMAGIVAYCTKHLLIGITLVVISLIIVVILNPVWFFILCFGIAGYYLKDIQLKKCVYWLLAFAIFFVTILNWTIGMALNLNSNVIFLLMAALATILISHLAVTPPQGMVWTSLDKWGSKIAPISYSLFLSHYQVLRIANHYRGPSPRFDMASISWFILVCFISLIVAFVIYQLVEKHTKKIELALNKLFSQV